MDRNLAKLRTWGAVAVLALALGLGAGGATATVGKGLQVTEWTASVPLTDVEGPIMIATDGVDLIIKPLGAMTDFHAPAECGWELLGANDCSTGVHLWFNQRLHGFLIYGDNLATVGDFHSVVQETGFEAYWQVFSCSLVIVALEFIDVTCAAATNFGGPDPGYPFEHRGYATLYGSGDGSNPDSVAGGDGWVILTPDTFTAFFHDGPL